MNDLEALAVEFDRRAKIYDDKAERFFALRQLSAYYAGKAWAYENCARTIRGTHHAGDGFEEFTNT